MKKEELEAMIRNGEIIITTKSLLKEAVAESVKYLYQDDGSFDKNRYADKREFNSLTDEECSDIGEEIIDYLTS